MPITGLDHINITAPAEMIEACRRFYADVLGLRDGERPPFRSSGYWLYAGERAVVHLTVADTGVVSGSAALDHFAFVGEDYDAMVAVLRAQEIAYRVTEVPLTGQVQIFLRDPAGVGIELGFAAR
jgi:glyoxylase I family protein